VSPLLETKPGIGTIERQHKVGFAALQPKMRREIPARAANLKAFRGKVFLLCGHEFTVVTSLCSAIQLSEVSKKATQEWWED
jgi:hypothetical protein